MTCKYNLSIPKVLFHKHWDPCHMLYLFICYIYSKNLIPKSAYKSVQILNNLRKLNWNCFLESFRIDCIIFKSDIYKTYWILRIPYLEVCNIAQLPSSIDYRHWSFDFATPKIWSIHDYKDLIFMVTQKDRDNQHSLWTFKIYLRTN